MFEYKYKVPKEDLGTTYGSICIKNIVFEPGEIEKVLPDIVFDDNNLKDMFAEDDLDDDKRKCIYKRFIPKVRTSLEMEMFIKDSIDENKSFYSFLAEGILGLIFKDLYGYKLSKGVIDVYDTLVDSHTGVDACMYSVEDNVIILGEAKFYKDFDDGITRIIGDFINKSIKNKLESLQRASENCSDSCKIIMKNLFLDDVDELTIDEFMNQTIIFAGFILHSEVDVSEYNNINFYDKYTISVEKLKNNINNSLNISCAKGDYEIIMVHLPIGDKKRLIAKVIETAQSKLKGMKKLYE